MAAVAAASLPEIASLLAMVLQWDGPTCSPLAHTPGPGDDDDDDDDTGRGGGSGGSIDPDDDDGEDEDEDDEDDEDPLWAARVTPRRGAVMRRAHRL